MDGQKHFTLEEMQEKALKLWVRYGERYRNLIPKYEKLVKIKRKLKITPLNQVSKSTLKDIPKIELLDIPSERFAKNRVKKMSASELSATILAIELMVDSYAFNTIEAHIYDYEYEIRHVDDESPSLSAVNPDAISSH